MSIQPVQSTIQKPFLTPKNTGWSAAAALGVCAISGCTRNKPLKKAHKPFAYLTALLTAVHIALIEYYHRKFK